MIKNRVLYPKIARVLPL